MDIRAVRPDTAIQPLATGATSDDPYVRYLAEHPAGLALEMLGRRADATFPELSITQTIPTSLSGIIYIPNAVRVRS